jgi:hypothetical protein
MRMRWWDAMTLMTYVLRRPNTRVYGGFVRDLLCGELAFNDIDVFITHPWVGKSVKTHEYVIWTNGLIDLLPPEWKQHPICADRTDGEYSANPYNIFVRSPNGFVLTLQCMIHPKSAIKCNFTCNQLAIDEVEFHNTHFVAYLSTWDKELSEAAKPDCGYRFSFPTMRLEPGRSYILPPSYSTGRAKLKTPVEEIQRRIFRPTQAMCAKLVMQDPAGCNKLADLVNRRDWKLDPKYTNTCKVLIQDRPPYVPPRARNETVHEAVVYLHDVLEPEILVKEMRNSLPMF